MIGGPVTDSGTSVTAGTALVCPNGDPSPSELAISYGAKPLRESAPPFTLNHTSDTP
jgi:hypothetical protein